MTRKRFKKLLMADGFSRNEAEAAAREIAQDGVYSYEQAYCLTSGAFNKAIERLNVAIGRVAKAAVDTAFQVMILAVEAMPQVLEKISNAVELYSGLSADELAELREKAIITEDNKNG